VTDPSPDRPPGADGPTRSGRPSWGDPDRSAWGGPPWGPPWAGAPGDRRHWGRRGGRRPTFGFVGCLLVFVVLFVGVVTALATWVAAALLGVLAPGAAPPTATAIAVIVVLIVAVLLGVRFFVATVRPMAELAAASERLADGEPGVRVEPRGPGPVRRAGASFNAMAERLDRSRDDRRALLADVTHELRTPLTVISGGLEAMLDGVHPMDEDHISPILAEAEVMDRLLDDLRTISLAEAGALPLHREPVDLVDLADDVLAAQRTVADARRVVPARTGDDGLEADVDPVRVREILVNLVANAVRHTPAGGRVTVDVRGEAGDAVLTVTDTGEGIAADEIGRVFDRFHRRSDSGGSGLGLTIVRDLAAAHGGSVGVASDGVPGRGSTFRVRLPRRL
jgi:two-component system sensor histidine kinase BaeS